MLHGAAPVPNTRASLSDFRGILRSLAYFPDVDETWARLGLAPIEGPDLSPSTIDARIRFARLLASGVDSAPWGAADNAHARSDLKKLETAAEECLAHCDEWKTERRRVRPSKVPL